MQPLATYEDRLPGRQFHFELFRDGIYVRGSTSRAEIETTIPLTQLDPSIMRVWVYSQQFYIGVCVFMASIVLLLAIVTVVQIQDIRIFPARAMGLAGAIAAVGGALIIRNRHRIEYAQFRSDAGVPILGIARSGADAEDFDQFVALLEKQIRIQRSQSGVGGSSMPYEAIDA